MAKKVRPQTDNNRMIKEDDTVRLRDRDIKEFSFLPKRVEQVMFHKEVYCGIGCCGSISSP